MYLKLDFKDENCLRKKKNSMIHLLKYLSFSEKISFLNKIYIWIVKMMLMLVMVMMVVVWR